MPTESIIQGRRLSAEELVQIQTLLAEHPSWHRTRHSRELCARWGWHNDTGRPKDMACRSLLLKLQARGLLELPPRQGASVNHQRNHRAAEVAHAADPLHAELEALRPVRVAPVSPGSPEAGLFQFLLQRYHYLGHRNCVG